MAESPKDPPSGRFARFRKLATLSAQLSTDVVKSGVMRLAGKDSGLFSKGAAEKLVATLGDMKGAAMKLGQAMSMDPDLLNPELRAVVSRLQNQAPAMAYETVAEVVERELGAAPQALFDRFDPLPLASASLGQVHAARLADGREVVVKVQYPGIEKALAADLDNLAGLVKTVFRTTRILDGRVYIQELRDEMLLEVDYRREAEWVDRFRAAAAGLPDLAVPYVVAERTTSRVLTLERVEGPTLRELLASDATPEERFRVGRLLTRATYGPFLARGLIDADPHPGNFVIRPDGRLGVLDFGSVKAFSEPFVAACRDLFKAGARDEPFDGVAIARRLGFTLELPDDEAREMITAVLHIAGRPLREEIYDWGRDDTAVQLRKFATGEVGRLLKFRPPPEAVLFFRSIGGLAQNLKALGAKGPFRAAYWELVDQIPQVNSGG